ncbi:FEZ1 protein, partial [Ceuthmochares aereus]|nr:FEZ1 protein [Ceuthmochares aereus]
MEGISSILHSGLRQTFGPAASEKQVPFSPQNCPNPSPRTPSLLTPLPCSPLKTEPWNILFAMKEGNEKVPTLLTDYILKGIYSLCAS